MQTQALMAITPLRKTERSRVLLKQSSSLQLVGRIILVAILVLLAIWILRRFLPALAWAGVLALGLYAIG
jgi:flagellar biogenesis protein FliO